MNDSSSAEIQNLLGVIEEKQEIAISTKYYRAALSLDPTYEPADNNLKGQQCLIALVRKLIWDNKKVPI
ncbi:MAG: hypothetical protein ACLTYB_05185 [Clostridium paraputrificum]